jgi:AcrR family transcriptional regulator
MGKANSTRARILEIAESAVLAKGFGATSIEEIIVEAGITKSGFFYHFKDKNELARAMLVRYVAANDRIFETVFGRARQLSDDPLQSFLIGLNLLAEMMEDLPNGHPGCLIATICYQERLFDREIREIMAESVKGWNSFFGAMIADIAKVYPARDPVELDHVANMVSCIVDGGIIMGKSLAQPEILPQQIRMVRSYVRLLFQPAPAVSLQRDVVAA